MINNETMAVRAAIVRKERLGREEAGSARGQPSKRGVRTRSQRTYVEQPPRKEEAEQPIFPPT